MSLKLLKMSVRYQRRINLGKGLGVNLSKSGMSVSKRTPFGSVGTSGYSIRTAIPGLFFRSYSGKKSKSNVKEIAIFLLIIALISALIFFAFNLLKALFLIIFHYSIISFRWMKQKTIQQKAKRDFENLGHEKDVLFVKFEHASLPENMKNTKVILKELLVKNGQQVSKNEEIAIIQNEKYEATLYAEKSGKIIFYAIQEMKIKNGSILYRIDEIN